MRGSAELSEGVRLVKCAMCPRQLLPDKLIPVAGYTRHRRRYRTVSYTPATILICARCRWNYYLPPDYLKAPVIGRNTTVDVQKDGANQGPT